MSRPLRLALSGLAVVAALLVGVVSGAAGTLLHSAWWALALALATGIVVVAALPPGATRLAFAAGWCLPVLRGALERPGGGYLIASDAAGWSFIAGSFVLLVASLATIRSGAAGAAARLEDPGLHP